jgi:hypothetical protein
VTGAGQAEGCLTPPGRRSRPGGFRVRERDACRRLGYCAGMLSSWIASIRIEVTRTWLWSVPPVSALQLRLSVVSPPIAAFMVRVPQLPSVSAPLMYR